MWERSVMPGQFWCVKRNTLVVRRRRALSNLDSRKAFLQANGNIVCPLQRGGIRKYFLTSNIP